MVAHRSVVARTASTRWARLIVAAMLASCGEPRAKPTLLPDAPAIPDSSCDLTCNVLTQSGCGRGEKCTWVALSPGVSDCEPECVPDGPVRLGGACTSGAPGPTGYDDCASGTVCVSGTCASICDLQGGAPTCEAGTICTAVDGLFGEPGQPAFAGACESP